MTHTAIDRDYLVQLRKLHRAERVLLLVQLAQWCPGWWVDQQALADDLGTSYAQCRLGLKYWQARGVVSCWVRSNGGTWVWWVKKAADDSPPGPEDAPGWTLRDITSRRRVRIPVYAARQWAAENHYPYTTFLNFLSGYRRTLDSRWQVVGSPYDEAEPCNREVERSLADIEAAAPMA